MKILKKAINRLNQSRFKFAFIIVGVLSTIWFLLRVIPKPSRASYPCMQTAAPIMSAFVLWLIGTGTFAFFWKRIRSAVSDRRFRTALLFVGPLLVSAALLLSTNGISLFGFGGNAAPPPDPEHPSLQPIGEAKGIFPGRVTWYYDKDATNEQSANLTDGMGIINNWDDVYYQAKNNDSAVIHKMMDHSVTHLTGAETVEAAWDSIFTYYNRNTDGGSVGYTPGEKIFIKTNNQGFGFKENMNSDLTQRDESAHGNFHPHGLGTSPYSVISTIDQLVQQVGVAQEDIYVGDPHQNFNNIYYDLLRNAFPNIHIMGVNVWDVTDCESYGRTLSVPTANDVIFYSDDQELSDKLYQQMVDAKYMINISGLKAHRGGGITLFAKNHFGSHTRETAMHLHPSLISNVEGYGNYRVFVDLMAHKDLGGKTVLFIIDGLWGSSPCELERPRKWDMAPFNGDWSSSIFMSLDPVAISSVGFDFLRTEFNNATWWNAQDNKNEAYPNRWEGVDDYLHQAATEDNWPAGFTYDPENDGVKVKSLGVHEHWNNASDMQYSGNLNGGTSGIELLKLHEIVTGQTPSANFLMDELHVEIYPNPARSQFSLSFIDAYTGTVEIGLYGLDGKLVMQLKEQKVAPEFSRSISLDGLQSGTYIVRLTAGNGRKSTVLLIE